MDKESNERNKKKGDKEDKARAESTRNPQCANEAEATRSRILFSRRGLESSQERRTNERGMYTGRFKEADRPSH